MDRREFCNKLGAAAFLAAGFSRAFAKGGKAERVMIVSGWQNVNIGDIAHTAGMISALKKHLPNVELTLWKVSPDKKVEEMLQRHFPDVKIVTGWVKRNGELPDGAVAEAAKGCDMLVHASGPSVVARKHINAWRKACGKPYGIFGVTIDKIDAELTDILKNAAFVFTRETASLENLKEAKIDGPACAFVPDATFAFYILDNAKADEFLSKNKLADKKFVCFVPRLRYTPYWEFRKTNTAKAEIERRKSVNARFEPVDSSKMRDAIEWLCRNTDLGVLLCPEMTYQVELCRKALYEPLKEKYGKRMAVHEYWLPDEAAAVYARAAGVLSFECHSPIIALKQGTPAVYLRQPEDTIKGQMYYDLPLSKWVFEIDNTDGTKIISALADIVKKPDDARKYVSNAIRASDALIKKGVMISASKL